MQYISQTFSRHYDYTYIHTYGLIRSRKYMVRDRKYGARLGFLNVCLGLKITRHSHMVEFKNVRNNMANRKIHVCLIALIWSLGKQVGKLSKNLWSTVIFNVLFYRSAKVSRDQERKKITRNFVRKSNSFFHVCNIMCFTRKCRGQLTCKLKGTSCTAQLEYSVLWIFSPQFIITLTVLGRDFFHHTQLDPYSRSLSDTHLTNYYCISD